MCLMKKSVTSFVTLKNYFLQWYLSLLVPLKKKQSLIAPLKSSLQILFILLYFSNISLAQCPTLFTEDLNGIPGYPELNDVSVCGVADTLTYYVLNNSGTTLLNSEFILHIPPGMQYGGFVDVLDPTYFVVEGDVSDGQNPSFIFENIGADSVQIITIGVIANCEVYDLPPTSEFKFDATFNFLYKSDEFSPPQSCTATSEGKVDYSPYIKRPSVNITAQDNPNVVIRNNNQVCNNITVTQTGIGATVTGFNFTVDGLDLDNFEVCELTIGGSMVPYTHDPATLQLSAFVDDSFLPNGYLGEDEGVQVSICYKAPLVCDTDQGIYNLSYGASFGCSPEEPPCVAPSTADGTLTYTPNFGANPIVDITQVLEPGICGSNAVFDAVITSANDDPVLGLWEEVKIGFQVCEADVFDPADVKINGVSLPAGSYYYENFDFVVDATTFNFDPDGPGVGFEDVDGDGVFDDIPGGNTVTMTIEVAVKCQNPEQIAGCASIDCEFSQATIEGLRHCGQAFQSTPSISPAPNFAYGSEYTTVNEGDISTTQNGSLLGFDFGTGTGPNDGNGYGSTNTVEMEFCYKYKAEGIDACMSPGGTPYFEIQVGGPQIVLADMELVNSSVLFDGAPVPAGNISSIYNSDTSSVVFRILAGSNDETIEQCYTWTFELDSCVCYPRQLLAASMRVVETCGDCAGPDGNDCTLVRACDETLLATTRSCDCVCPMSATIKDSRRVDFGYTDKASTTAHDETTVDPLDLNRYLPCDSVYIHIEYEVIDPLALNDLDEMIFRLYNTALGGGTWSHRPTFELEPDMHNTQIQDFSFEKVGSGTETSIEFGGCNTDNASLYHRNLNDGYLDALGSTPTSILYGVSTYNSSFDVFDNREFSFTIHDRERQVSEGNATHGLSGDCWEYVREDLMGGLQKGDKFHLKVHVPLQKNPYRQLIPEVAATPPSQIVFNGNAFWYKYVGGNRTYVRGTCNTTSTIETYCPGPVIAETDYNVSDCDAMVSHTFTMEGTPDDWYINEWRPDIMELDTLLVPIPSPMVYAGNPRIVINGDTIPISDPIFDDNTFCAVDTNDGQNKCTSVAGQTGYMMFDVSELPNFGVGLAGTDCTFELCYDLERICPGPISTPENYAMYYDYSFTCDYTPGGHYCNSTSHPSRANFSFLGNQTEYPVEDCNGGGSFLIFDQKDYHLTEDTSFTLNFNDVSSPLPVLSSTITNTLLVDAASASEFNTYEVCAGPGTIPHENVMTTIFLEPTVDLINITDGSGGAVTYTLSNSNASGNTYLIEHNTDLNAGECVTFELETELKICPYPGIGTMVNVKTTSSCLDLEFASKLFGVGGDACIATGQAYEYVAGEAEIQAEWEPPTGNVALCSTNEFIIVVKNTKIATLKELEFNFNLPNGLFWLPGSFEYEYPEASGTWVSISDPVANGGNAFGPLWTMTDDEMVADIDPNGLPGILDPGTNANRLRIRFDAKTECDEYISNTPLYFETTAADPCESRTSSGFTKNEGIIVNNAVPADNAQFLLTADPIKYTCGEPVPISIAGVNLSKTGGETFMSEACFTFPPELAYTPGSFQLTTPSSWTPTYVDETVLPGGYIQICFDLPDGIKPFEIFGFSAEVIPDPTAMCEEILFGGQVKSLVEDQICVGDDSIEGTGDDSVCDVYVNNTINDQIPILVSPPAEMTDIDLVLECDNDPDSATYEYTLELYGVSTTDYEGPLMVEWYRDLNLNGTLDPTDPLMATDNIMVNVLSGQASDHTGTVTLPEAFSCPVLVKTTVETVCNCSMDVYYMEKPPTPAFVAQFDGPVQLCPGDDFAIGICSGFDFNLSGSGEMTETADSLFVVVPLGGNAVLNITSQHADCMEQDFQIEIMSLDNFEIGPFETMQICDMECTALDLNIPEDWVGNMMVTWSPATFLDDPTSFTPMICNPTENIIYTVTITNPNSGCTAEAEFPVEVLKTIIPNITYDGYEDCFLPYDPAKLIVEPAGLSNYNFYYIDENSGGPDVLLQSGTANEFTLPFAEGKFYAIVEDQAMCMVPTDTLCLEVPTCIFDLALTKVLSPTQPLPIKVGDKVTFDITIYNQGTVGADSITVTDNIPAGFALMDATWTDVGGGAAEYFYLGPLAAGDSVLIPVMVEVQSGITTSNSTNQAEISEAFNENDEDYPDVDSVEDNDPDNDAGGDPNAPSDNQTDGDGTDDEDDADPATIPIFDLALKKTLATAGPYTYGDTLTFDITVYNQGNVTATNIEVTDYIACGYVFDTTINPDWMAAGSDANTTITDTLAGNDSTVVSINLILQSCDMADGYRNTAEISGSEDDMGNDTTDSDVDSTADDDGSNDGDMEDNTTDGTNDDEDDSDFATPEIFDLAQIKEVVTEGPYMWGDTLQYAITVVNQGNVPATNIEITDNLPIGLTYDAAINPTWTGTAPVIMSTITDTLAAFDTVVVDLYLILTEAQGGAPSFTNISEISASEDDMGNDTSADDADSTPNGNPADDAGGIAEGDSDNQFDGNGMDDEDDHDPALVEIFDLALTKTTMETGPFRYGDTLTFDFNIFNQGTMPATNIEITEFTPCGYLFDASINPDWALVAGYPTTTITDTLGLTDSLIVSIHLIVQPCEEAGAWKNTGEISGATNDEGIPQEDIDSTADSNPDNDGEMSDNENGNDNGDEDDSDFELIEIFDLAQKKELLTSGPYNYGDTLRYAITVVNQGNIPATNIMVTDYLPTGLTYDATLNPTWTGADPTVTHTITDTLQEGDIVVVYIELILTQTTGGDENYTNTSEITSSEDDMGNDTTNDDADDDDGNPDDNQNEVDNSLEDGDDDRDTAPLHTFDLALTKTTSDVGPFSYGDVITFDFTVYNQGNIPATNIEITEQTPCGYQFDSALNPDWLPLTDAMATTVIGDTLQAGDSTIVSVVFIIEPCYEAVDNAWKNTGEISASEDDMGNDTTDDDIDSNADGDPSNDGDMSDNDINGENGDEDDSDFELIEIFDLAQKKTLVSTGPHAWGDTLQFDITIYNQGNVTTTNIEVTDFIPAGFAFDASLNPNWSGAAPVVTSTITDTLNTGDSTVVSIYLTLEQTSGGNDNYTNISEISGSEDAEGNDTTNDDIDSTADDDPTDDAGGEVGEDSDDQTDGDGINDEDDHDPAIVEIFDLALKKTTTDIGPFAYGDVMTFDFTVYNQGNIPSTNIEVTDYIPCGYAFDAALNPDWSLVGTDAKYIITDVLQGGDSAIVSIDLILQPCDDTGAWKNIGEISGSEDDQGNDTTNDDIDSFADDDRTNDGEMDDNMTDGTNADEDDSDYDNSFDEDDSDPEVVSIFDLAQIKEIVTTGPYAWGDTLQYAITVVNQGNIPATNITVTDNIPAGLTYDAAINPTWMGAAPNVTNTITDTLEMGDTSVVFINLILTQTDGGSDNYTNTSEITSSEDDKGNDTTDADADDDDGDADDNANEEDNSFEDGDDDLDEEFIRIFDLALKKTTSATGPFYYGDIITFDYTVYNQGNIPSTNIAITDYTPCGYEFDASLNPDWTLSGTDATTVITDLVAPGDSIIVSINYIVEACDEITNSAWRNTGEITASEDDKGNDTSDEDVDSTTDSDPNNDGDMSDNDTDGSNGDEDDSDFELIQIFDLAQKKEIVTPGPYAYGDVVTYAITVYNQGNIPATNIGVSDFIPSGLIYDPALNPTWSGAAPIVTTVITDTLWSTGDSMIVYIDLSIAPTNDGLAGYTNIAEINGSEDEKGNDTSNNDADSKPDNDPTNDNGGIVGESSDNQVNGSSENDEDDQDPALVEVFDLALNKTTSTPGPYAYGDIMTYDLTVYNQGSVVASIIEISDHLPCGFKFLPNSNPTWNYDAATGLVTTTINSLLLGGDSITVQLLVEIQACGGTASWRNTAEISGATDGEGNPVTDIDSISDNDPTNDGDMEDNAIDGSNGDEDDSDFHNIEVFDLAFKKQLAPTQESPVLPGSDVAYQMTIYNQGNVDAFDITVIDYIPDGLAFDLAANTAASAGNTNDWNLVDDVPTYIINTLAPLDSIVINITFTIDGGFRGTGITNFGEIAHAADAPGGPNTPDADSNADGDMENDNHAADDSVNGYGNQGGDEDDHDPAFIQLFAQEDIIIIGNTDLPTIDTIVTDTITDVDPEATPVFEEEIEEEVDCSEYPVYCYHGLAIELMPIGMAETWASDVSVNDYSSCPDYRLGIWHNSMPMKQPATLAEVRALPTNLIFTCATLGNQEVQLYVTDPEGNWNFCETYINVQDNNKGCVETQSTDATNALLGGQVNTWKGDAVQEVLLSTTQIDYMTTQDGFYHFELPMEESYTVTPQKNHIPLNGVSTFDLVLMTKHILGVQPFDNPYQWIAADVNQSKTVTAFDLVQLRKLILAIDTEFTNNTSWRFVEANYDFTSDNPLTEDFPEQAHISNLSSDMVMNFVAIKIGDVNGNVRPNALQRVEPRNSDNVFKIQVADQFLKAGQNYQIDLYAKDISKIQGYQFTVNTKDVMIDQIHGALMTTENFGLNNLDAGRITVSWNQQPNYLVSEEKLFTIQLQATKDTRLSEVLQLNNRPTVAEAYDLEDNIMEVQLQFTNDDSTTDFDLAQNQPNPFRSQTSIGYTLPNNSPVELILRDEAGRVIQVVKQDGKAGYNLIPLDDLDMAPGFIYYQLITKFGTKSKKMIRVE